MMHRRGEHQPSLEHIGKTDAGVMFINSRAEGSLCKAPAMKTKLHVSRTGSLKVLIVVAAVVAVAIMEVRLARHFAGGGSGVTNPDAFASEQVAAGLRIASR